MDLRDYEEPGKGVPRDPRHRQTTGPISSFYEASFQTLDSCGGVDPSEQADILPDAQLSWRSNACGSLAAERSR